VQAPAAIVEAALVTPFSGVFLRVYQPICSSVCADLCVGTDLEGKYFMTLRETSRERVILFEWLERDFQWRYCVNDDEQSGFVKTGNFIA
jgi:hypothetical protein